MQPFRWDEIPPEQMNPAMVRQAFHGDHLTVARISLLKGAVVPAHQHHNEQITFLLSGRIRFLLQGGRELILEAGQMLRIPPMASHGVEALDDGTVAMDVFSPPREDWKTGDDAYLRSSSR